MPDNMRESPNRKQRNHSHEFFRNLSSITVARLGASIGSFIVFWLIAKKLGSNSLGIYSYLYAGYSIIQTLSSIGLQPFLIRESSKNAATSSRLLSNSLLLATFSSILGLVIFLIIFTLFRSDLRIVAILFGFSILPSVFITIYESFYITFGKGKTIAKLNLFENAIRIALVSWALSNGYSLESVILWFLLTRLFLCILYVLKKEPEFAFSIKLISKRSVVSVLKDVWLISSSHLVRTD